MDKKAFGRRLSELRKSVGITAKEMSLALGQGHSYINNIECGVCYPTMERFFGICDYLQIQPSHFFDLDRSNPARLNQASDVLNRLSERQIALVVAIAQEMQTE